MTILVFALVFALFPATAMAQEVSEQIDVSGYHEVVESDRFKITSEGGAAWDGMDVDADWPMLIEAKKDHMITKVELAVESTRNLTLDRIVPSRGAVSGNLTDGGTVVISDIHAPGVEIRISTGNGFLFVNTVTIYYEDKTVASYKNTTTAVHFNGMEWYVINSSSTDATLLSKDCIGESQFNPTDVHRNYLNSIIEKYVMDYYDAHFSAVDSAVLYVTPEYYGLGYTEVEGNQAKLWLISTYDYRNTLPEVKKCNPAPGSSAVYWWLRTVTMSKIPRGQYIRCSDGKSSDGMEIKHPLLDEVQGVRPALLLDLSKVYFVDETKTIRLKDEYISQTSLSLTAASDEALNIGDAMKLTAAIEPTEATNGKIQWSTSGLEVELYTDEACQNPLPVGPTAMRTVYAKGMKEGSVTVTITSNEDSTISASCDLTVKAVPVGGVTLSAPVDMATGGVKKLTAGIIPENATDKTVLWSVGGENANAVKLYADETCTIEVGAEATTVRTVYARPISAGVTTVNATVTVTTNEDRTKTLSQPVTMEAVAAVTAGGSTTIYFDYAEALAALNAAEDEATMQLLADVETKATTTSGAAGGTRVLDLNSHALQLTDKGSVLSVADGATLKLTDTSGEKTGSVTGADEGAGVYVSHGGTFILEGGTISGNKSTVGAGVFSSGTFTMSGGTISGNQAEGEGGGVYIKDGTFTMTGGTISGNEAKHGGGVLIDAGGTFTMSGGSITGNTAELAGGVAPASGTVTMNGGSITGNTAKLAGGVLVNKGGTFTMSGGSITQNAADNGAGGVFVNEGGTFRISGAPVITGNTSGTGNSASNAFLVNEQRIILDGVLNEGASIGVTMMHSDEVMNFTPNSGVFTSGLPGKGSTGNFTSDDTAYTVALLDDEAALMDSSSATRSVTITAGDHMTKTGDSGEATQTGLTGAMTDVVYTADEGYYFPEDYSVHDVHGVSVTRNSFTRITVSGTPTADAAVTLPATTAKTKPDAPSTARAEDCTTADNNDGKITGVTTEMEYKKSDADDWTDVTGSDITDLVPGTYDVRVRATDTTFASDNRELIIRGRVASPVFTPAAGSYIGTQRVELTCATEDATIYYTTDGSEPTSDSTAYTGVIRLSADTSFRAVAVKEGMRDSVVAEAAYTIAKPTYTLSVSAPAFDDAIVGYTQPEAQAITITSSGNSDALINSVTLSGDQADSFTLQKGTVSVPAGGTNTSYTIRPGADLPEGIYMAAISVAYNNGAVATADVRFRVNADPTSGIGVGSTWYVGDSICLSGKWFVRSDSDHEAVRGDYHTNTVPNPATFHLNEVPYWFFDNAVSVTDGGNPSLLLAVPNGRTVSDVPTGFRIRGGSGTEEDPFTFEPVYDERPFVSVTGVTLSPSAAQSVAVGGHVALTATVSPEDAADRKVKWSVSGPKAGAVTLYFDEACTAGNEVGTDATDTLTVYAKGISTGRATVTVTSNADSTRSASCDVTVKEYYPVWVGGAQVTSENAGNIDGENKAIYNPETKTLTLNNYSYTGAGYSNGTTSSFSAIRAEQPLTIELKGDNTLTHTPVENLSFGIFVENGDLTITGSGTLTAHAGDAWLNSAGIWVYGSGYTLTIDSGATVKANGGNIGAGAQGSVVVNGTLEATAGSVSRSYGVEADSDSLLIYTDGSVTAKGQTSALNAPYTVLPAGQRAEESANIDGSGATAVAAGSNTATGAKYVKIWPGTHRHSFLYTADGATIYATCAADGCTLADREVTLTLNAPTLTTPGQTGDGISASATLTGLEAFNAATGLHVAETDIQYYTAEEAEAGGQSNTRPGYRLDEAPTDLGDYCAVLTLTNRKISETETGDVQAMVSYTIAVPLEPVTITATDQEVTYSAEGIVLPMEGMFTFSEGAGEATYDVTADTGTGTWDAQTGRLSVTACGTFRVTVSTAATDTHAAAKSSAVLTVNKAEETAPTIASKAYNAQLQTADVADSDLYTVTSNEGGRDAGTYDVVLTLKDAANTRWTDSEEAAKTLSFRITKATAPTVTVPSPAAVTYDPAKTLADVALTEGWAWVNAATVPTVVNEGYEAALTVDDANYDYTGVEGYSAETHTVTRTVPLTVNKAEVTAPTIVAKTYTGETLTADVPESSLYTVTANNGGITAGTYDVVLTLTDSANYRWTDREGAATTLTFRITAATAPTVTIPNPAAVTYDPAKTLADVVLADGWAWVTAATVPTVVNEGYEAALTVDDTNYDYTGVEGYSAETHKVTRTVALTVNKAEVTAPAIAGKTYTGETLTADVPESSLYTVTANDGGTAPGTYEVVLTLKDAANTKWTDSEEATKTLSFQITKATAPAVTVPSPAAVTYDPEKTLADVALANGWAWVTAATVPTVGNAGYEAALTVDDTNYDYTGVEGYSAETHKVTRIVALTVNKAAPTVTAPIARTLTYSGSGQELVDAGSTADGTMYYAVTAGNTAPTDESAYTTSVPTGTDAGTYYVWYRVAGDANHSDTDPAGPIAVTIDPREAVLTWSNLSFVYDGTLRTPTAAVSNLIGTDSCTVTVTAENDAVDAGSHTATATALSNGNYALPAENTKDYTIGKAAGSIRFSPESLICAFDDGTVSIRLENKGDGTVTYSSGNTAVATVDADTGEVKIAGTGTAVITATVEDGKNFHYEIPTATCTMTVNPSGAKVTALPEKISGLTYTGAAQNLITAGKTSDGTIEYALGTGTAPTDSWSTDIPTGTEAGPYYVWYRVVGGQNHEDSKAACVIGYIAPAAADGSVSAKTIYYTGEAQPLVEEGKSDDGTFWYALGDNATTPPAENSDETPNENRWSTSVPVGTEVGTYYVWWQLKGYPPNYKDIEPTVIVANIELEEISFTVTFRVANGSWNDGTAADKTVTLTGYKHLLQLYLTESLIPAVGNRPNEGYQAGDWTTQEPTHELPIDEDMTFIYEYQPKTVYTLVPDEENPAAVYGQGTANGLLLTFRRSSADGTGLTHIAGVEYANLPRQAGVDYETSAPEGQVRTLTLLPAFLDTLPYGEHTLTVAFEDGDPVSVTFTVIPTYTVAFDTGGHGTAPEAQTVTRGRKAAQPADLSVKDYDFGGWYTDQTCTDAYNFNAEVTEDLTLYAKWTPFTYSLESGGGQIYRKGSGSGLQFVIKRSVKDETTLGHFEAVAYGDRKLGDGDYTAGSGSLVLMLQPAFLDTLAFETHTVNVTFNDASAPVPVSFTVAPAEYSVSFSANGHGTAPAAQTVTDGGKATQPNALAATGYTFGGWYTDESCTSAYNFDTPVTGNLLLYAKWTPVTYTVTFNANGHGTAPAAQSVEYGGKATQPTAPTASGYTFGGWYTDRACTVYRPCVHHGI